MSPPSDTPGETAHTGTPEETAREFAARFGREAFADAVASLTEAGRDAVVDAFPEEFQEGPLEPEGALERYWRGLYCQYGTFEGTGGVSVDGDTATVELDFAAGNEVATVDVEDGGVAGLSFAPEYERPDYVDTGAFDEREVTVDAGDVDLEGVLAVPDGEGPFPGVVFVHGHGIHDPDGTAGASKVLRDLAWGLASEGIASLRYAKRLRDHEVPDEEFTLDRVVVDDAVAAASTLADAEAVDADRAFVAGHSQGGMAAPRIADRHGGLAGVVALDPPAETVPDPEDLTFVRYGMEPDGELDEEQRERLRDQRETFRRIAEGDYEDDETVMGMPGAWHRSHRDADPVGTASGLDAPAFVASTGRTDRVTQRELYDALRDRYETWRTADLPAGSRTEFYEHVGHYFQDGPAPVTPLRLYFGGNVADYVVADVANWIHRVAGD